MFQDNLVQLRKLNHLTQEGLAEKVGVTRQAIAKWETGESEPTLEKAKLLSEALGVSLDDLTNFESGANMGISAPPKGKYLFGVVTVGEKGQIVIPAKARKVFGISPEDEMVILGDESQGLALVKTDFFLAMTDILKERRDP